MNKRIEKIIANYFDSKISGSEVKELIAWIKKGNKDVFNEYVSLNFSIDQLKYAANNKSVSSWEKIALKINDNDSGKIVPLYKRNVFKYAAAILIFVSAGYFFLTKDNLQITEPTIVTNNIKVGTDKATLTLEDGSEIRLEKGMDYIADNLTSNGEELIYNTQSSSNIAIAYNYLTIPRGGQYFVKLSDGTQVWLNSESKLKYPVSFVQGETRVVELIYGEAYFNVSPSTNHNDSKFKVHTGIQEVEVLGTEFNIKAYKDEKEIYTTLVEGIVSVTKGVSNKLLNPGFQSLSNVENDGIILSKVDVDYVTAWKRGLFVFEKESLNTIMKRLSRWYNIDVEFSEKSKEDLIFSGFLDRHENIEMLLSKLELTGGVEFQITNKTIVIK